MPEGLQIHSSNIHNKIYTIRGERVMIDRDLAEIYGVETRTLNQQLKEILNVSRLILCFNLQILSFNIGNHKL